MESLPPNPYKIPSFSNSFYVLKTVNIQLVPTLLTTLSYMTFSMDIPSVSFIPLKRIISLRCWNHWWLPRPCCMFCLKISSMEVDTVLYFITVEYAKYLLLNVFCIQTWISFGQWQELHDCLVFKYGKMKYPSHNFLHDI